MPPVVGGTGAEKDADDDIQELIKQVHPEVVLQLDAEPPQFTAIRYKSQLVAGVNFFVKVKLDEGRFAHLRIYRNLQGEVQLSSMQLDKTEEEEVVYFE